MKLKVKERLLIERILPEKYGLIEGKLKLSILEKINFTSDEIKNLGLKDQDGGRIIWDATKDIGVEIDFNEREIELLKKGVENLDKEKKLNDENIRLAVLINEL